MTPVKAAIFDIGATLVTGPPAAPNKVIAKLLTGVTAAEISSVIMTTELSCAEHACEVLSARFGPLAHESKQGVIELYNSQSSAASEIEGACDVVMSLKSRGMKIGLLSDIWNPYYTSVEKALPCVVENADSIVLSCRSGIRKPSPDNFLRSLSELNARPDEAVMIGDTYTHDILPALELGMHAVWVLARPDRESESIIRILNGSSPAPTFAVSNIQEVAALPLWEPAASNYEVPNGH